MSISVPPEPRLERPWYRLKRTWVLALLLLLALVSIAGGSSDKKSADKTDSAATLTTTTSADDSQADGSFEDAEGLVDQDKYDDALVLAGALGDRDSSRIRRKISRTIAARALAALTRGNRSQARQLINKASGYAATPQLASARSELGAATERAAARRQAVSAFASCDANITAKTGSTTCPFAENVFWSYYSSGQADSVDAYSPASGRDYQLSCADDGSTVDCTGTDGAEVRFPTSAVLAYSDDQAEEYAATHDIGEDGAASDDSGSDPDATSSGSACDSNYSGACVPSDQGDVNCPEVDGPVSVVGEDVYGLDRDGDGTGCDS